MDSYGVYEWSRAEVLAARFDKLYDMDKQKLKYLAGLRGVIYKEEEMNI